MFADNVEITVQAGKGGDGRLSFLQEKYRAKGGPDGGNGGRGGSVVFEVTHNLNTLSAFRRKKLIKAQDGEMGGTNHRNGKAGEDIIIPVPEGTQIYEAGELMADLTEDGERTVVAKGGRGGFGNAHFTSSTRQAPRAVEVGDKGEHRLVKLELKLVADIGLVGLPNAGKSTLLSVITNAKPEIADYPFTTLIPNLGVVDHRNDSFLAADIPGLIEGASQGKGLGDEFLRHIERTAVLVHLVDARSDDIARDFNTIQNELKSYAVDLTAKPQLIVISKSETVQSEQLKQAEKALKVASGQPVFVISSVAHKGLDHLLDAAAILVAAARKERSEIKVVADRHVIDEASQPDLWQVGVDGDRFVVSGQKIEGFARRTSWDQDGSVDRLRDILHKQGISKELEKRGAIPGSVIKIGDHELIW